MSLHIDNMILPGNEKSFTIGSRTQATSFNDLHPFFRALLDKPVTASVATINADGRPQLTPNWCTYDGTYLYLNSVRDRRKDRNIRARPDVTVMLVNPENPYHWMTIYGVVEQIIEEDDPQLGHLATESIDGLASKYLNASPYPFRDPQGEVRVLYKVRPTQIVTFGSIPKEGVEE
jgi:PPOX class probable F420-dependent enzyme